jgi:predicted deacetylase
MSTARALCIVIHDVAPATWSLCRRLADAVAAVDPQAPLTLLTVPNFHDGGEAVPAGYIDWLHARVARGDEIALHGYTHRDESAPRAWGAQRLVRRVYTAAEGEFAALSRTEATRRIARGRLWCAAHALEVHGFVPPAWLLGREALQAVREFDFDYITSLTHFIVLRTGRRLYAPSLVYSTRSAPRRTFSRVWNRALAASTGRLPLMRLGLHPADAQYVDIMRHAQSVLDRLRRVRVPLTKYEYARRLQLERPADPIVECVERA